MSELAARNTDRELWREREDDYYAPSLFVTEGGGIGMNVGGIVVVKPIRDWHALACSDKAFRGWSNIRDPSPSGDVMNDH